MGGTTRAAERYSHQYYFFTTIRMVNITGTRIVKSYSSVYFLNKYYECVVAYCFQS